MYKKISILFYKRMKIYIFNAIQHQIDAFSLNLKQNSSKKFKNILHGFHVNRMQSERLKDDSSGLY